MSDTIIEGRGNIFAKQAVQLARNASSSCNVPSSTTYYATKLKFEVSLDEMKESIFE